MAGQENGNRVVRNLMMQLAVVIIVAVLTSIISTRTTIAVMGSKITTVSDQVMLMSNVITRNTEAIWSVQRQIDVSQAQRIAADEALTKSLDRIENIQIEGRLRALERLSK